MFGAKKLYRVNTFLTPLVGGNGDLRAFAISLLGTANMSAPGTSLPPLTINGVSLGTYDYIVKQGAQTISSFTAADWFTTAQDTRSAWIVVNGNLTINAGITVIPAVRKLFTVVYVQGNLVLNGSISMSLRGSNHSGDLDSTGTVTAAAIRIATGTLSGVSNPTILAAGGAGGSAVTAASTAGNNGTAAGSVICTGGGGSGSKGTSNSSNPAWGSGAGAAGTSFSGGAGGGAFADFFNSATGPASAGGPAGGRGGASSGGANGAEGGVGNPSPVRNNGTADNGTGGVLVVIATGGVTGSGSLTANGGSQTAIAASPAPNSGFCGGASGGGLVCLIAPSSTATLSAAGGTAISTGGATFNGGSGGAGYTGTLIG